MCKCVSEREREREGEEEREKKMFICQSLYSEWMVAFSEK